MPLRSWIRLAPATALLAGSRRSSRRRVPPAVQLLEDRIVPATFAVDGPGLLLDHFVTGEQVTVAAMPTGIEVRLTQDTWAGTGSHVLRLDPARLTIRDSDGGAMRLTFAGGAVPLVAQLDVRLPDAEVQVAGASLLASNG